jgi:predicted alpha-1,2-mannosidase
MKLNRRVFLKTASAGLASATVPAVTMSAERTVQDDAGTARAQRAKNMSPLDEVNLLQGTDSTGLFSRGNTLPIAALPFGMAHWTFQSSEEEPWFFHPQDRRLQGIRCTHQLSPWLGDYGQATFLPFQGEIDTEPGSRGASWRPERSKLAPHVLKLRLERYLADLVLVPTTRGAILQVTFDQLEGDEASLVIDLPGTNSVARFDEGSGTVYCASSATSGGTPEGFLTHYALRVDAGDGAAILGCKVQSVKSGCRAVVRYRAKAGVPTAIRIGTSFISEEQGALNLSREIGKKSVEEVEAAGRAVWEEHLGRAVIEGGTPEQRCVFYSALYRALLFPRTWHEVDASGATVHYSAYNGKVEPGVMYADHGYWDVYRAWYPLMSILFEDRLGEILQAWVNAAREGGWLPQFPCPGYRGCMTGSLIDSVFGDAAAKGIGGFDLSAAYAALKKHATTPGDPDKGYGRRGIEYYLKLGYLPAERVGQSVAETADAAYGDFCIAQVAKALGKHGDAEMFEKRSENWRHLYDPSVHFLRGKHEDGQWLSPFNPIQWGSPYVEGSAWQHRWDVPQNAQGLIEAMGGETYVAEQLETMLTMAPAFNVGVYGEEIHEMSEMAAVDFGQYAHSNQPVHHVLYLFALAGRPDRTQYWARKVMNELYTPDAFPGDEDTGSMSAWYLLSACGFYPFCPGKAEYVVGSPLFERVTLKLKGERTLTIGANNNSAANVYVKQLRVNGSLHHGPTISHAVVTAGGSLEFSMSASAK